MRLLLLAILVTAGCVRPIDDGGRLGPLITVGDSFTSSFLLPTDDGAVLFDAGFNGNGTPLLDALEAEGLAATAVTDVFLTHGHGDHVAGLTAFPGARLRAFPQEQALLDEEETGRTIDAPLTDREVLILGGRTIEAFHVPGHTAGNAAYLVEGVLLLGDSLLVNAQGALEQPSENFSDDPELLDQSLLALRDLLQPRADEIAWTACAHSGPLEGSAAFMAYNGPRALR